MRRSALGFILFLSACGKLPAPETAAFKTLAESDRDSFTATTTAERDALTALAVDQTAAGRGRILYDGCDAVDTAKTCTLTLVVGQHTQPLTLQAPESQKLISAIARYGGAMADLAAAKDLDTLNAKIDSVSTAIAGLATATGVGAPVAPITKLIASGIKASFKEKRRQILLIAAEAAQPLVQTAADNLGRQTAALKVSIVAGAGPRLSTARLDVARLTDQIALIDARLNGTPPPAPADLQSLLVSRSILQARAVDLTRDEVAAAAQINGARAINADFSSLAKGHQAIVTALRSDKPDLSESLTQLQGFLSTVKDLKTSL